MINRTTFGPLTAALLSHARWTDGYPGIQDLADECERLLGFLDQCGELDRYRPRLTAKHQQRDEALQEIRVAYFLNGLGYKIHEWEPEDAGTLEFSISKSGSELVFVEVKSPGWESELTDAERAQGRAKFGKFMGRRAIDPMGVIRKSVKKAQQKFSGKVPSLLVIADDCFVPLAGLGSAPLKAALLDGSVAYGKGLLEDPQFSNIGAVSLFGFFGTNRMPGIQYDAICHPNPHAQQSAQVPQDLISTVHTIPWEPTHYFFPVSS
jgi:hypothetical protein